MVVVEVGSVDLVFGPPAEEEGAEEERLSERTAGELRERFGCGNRVSIA